MRYLAVLLLIAAALPFNEIAYCQNTDSLFLSSARIQPGDTAIISLYLRNQSFSVGGFRIWMAIPDSSKARFIEAQRGQAVGYFDYFNRVPFSNGTLGITAIADTPPEPIAPPLPRGYHELAIIKIVVDDTVAVRTALPIVFLITDGHTNMITDSSGYLLVTPVTINGEITIESVTALPESHDNIPGEFELRANYPNPFNAHTRIDFSLNESGSVKLDIYDIQGRLVRKLLNGYYEAGFYGQIWDGRSDAGKPLASGIYLYKLTFDNNSLTRKMNYLK